MKQKLLSAIQNRKACILFLESGQHYVISTPAQIGYPPEADYVLVHDTATGGGRFEKVSFDQISDVSVEPVTVITPPN